MAPPLSFLGAMLHSSVTANISENPKSGRKIARVLVIYTGGTIGMKKDKDNGKLKLLLSLWLHINQVTFFIWYYRFSLC